ncbi:MAG: hypothetical protein E6G56_01000 [Actinobacteria bacterium]|nr:MAG: hypothetical protein E6G56_01000 [Actinomycetota bacterium]
MARIEALPPDQRAVLTLVLKQGRSYEELASLLRIDEETVRERAHAAVDALGPSEGEIPDPAHRADIADFLLGQQPASRRAATRSFLERSAAGRAWARVVAGELRPISEGALPEIPAEAEEMEEAFDALHAREHADRRSSRLGGALLLGGLGILVAVVLILVLTGGGKKSNTNPAVSPAPSTDQASGPTGATGQPQVVAQINLSPPRSGGRALGVANVLTQGGQRALALQAQGLPPSSTNSFYAVWLYNSQTDAQRLGFAPPVSRNGRLQAVSALPDTAARFHQLVITAETARQPSQPGHIVLAGPISLQ